MIVNADLDVDRFQWKYDQSMHGYTIDISCE